MRAAGETERDRERGREGGQICLRARRQFLDGGIHNKLLEFCTRFSVQHAIIVKLPSSSAIATGMLFYIIVLIVACHDTVY